MEEFTELWHTVRKPADLASDLPETQEFRNLYGAFNDASKAGIDQLGRQLGQIRDELTAAQSRFEAALGGSRKDRDKIMEKLIEHRSVTTQIDNLQAELKAIVEEIGTVQNSMTDPDKKFGALAQAIANLKQAVEARATKTAAWAKQIEALSAGRIKADLHVDGEWSEIREAVDRVSAKSGSVEAVRQTQVDEQIERSSPWQFLDALRADCLSALRYRAIGSALAGDRPAYGTLARTIRGSEKTLGQCLELMDVSRVEAIATAVPRPDITLSYCDEDRKIPFEAASEGQRAAALLMMLLEQPGGPLLVDQPEGDLDNRVISAVTDKLHEAKQRRQIIWPAAGLVDTKIGSFKLHQLSVQSR